MRGDGELATTDVRRCRIDYCRDGIITHPLRQESLCLRFERVGRNTALSDLLLERKRGRIEGILRLGAGLLDTREINHSA